MRSFDVLNKGVVVVPNTTRWTGPWLSATRAASLQRVANRPIVCHVLDALRDAGVVEIAVVAPSDVADELVTCIDAEQPADVEVRHLVYEPDRTGEALLALAEFVGDDACLLHRADGLLGQPLPSLGELLAEESSDALLLLQDDDGEVKRLRLVPQRVLRTVENGLTPTPNGVAGVCLLGPGVLGRLAKLDPVEQTLDLAVLAQRLAGDGGRVQMRFVHRWRHFAGDALDLLDMNRMVLDALDPEIRVSATDGNRFEGAIAIHPTASVHSSVIIGPVIIGAEALVADSYIGPHTSIAERVRIEGAELERSIVLADASVLHVGGRLVASIVGREARIFRDFSMPRALRLQVGDGDEVALC
jgi:glucose-1-phosphate thymidylyltransferase